MTIDALHGPVELSRASGRMAIPAIGTPDANIFLCPRCSRPLAVGVSRCAGCGTRLVAGVPLLKVSGFVGLGLVLGLVVGGGLVGALTLLGNPASPAVAVPPVAVTPSTAPIASGVTAPSTAPAPSAALAPGIPQAALTALRQSTTVNSDCSPTPTCSRRRWPSAIPSPAEIAPLLRNLASTAAFGDRIATTVGTWDEGGAVADALAHFYGSIDRVAADGLGASVINERAYRDAGRRMLALLEGISDLDKAARSLAASVKVELPPLRSTAN